MASTKYEFLNTGERVQRAIPFFAKGMAIRNNTNAKATVYDGIGAEIGHADASNVVQGPINMVHFASLQLAGPTTITGVAYVEFYDNPVEAKSSGTQGPINVLGENSSVALAFNNSTQTITLDRNSNVISIFFTNTITGRGQLSVDATVNGQVIPILFQLNVEAISPGPPFTRQLFMPLGTVITITFTGIGTLVVQY